MFIEEDYLFNGKHYETLEEMEKAKKEFNIAPFTIETFDIIFNNLKEHLKEFIFQVEKVPLSNAQAHIAIIQGFEHIAKFIQCAVKLRP